MSGKDNNTPKKKGGSPSKKAGQQPPSSPSAQALVRLDIHPGNGRITFNNQSFANFDNVMQHIQEQPVPRRERLLHGLLTNMIDFRDHWSDEILRFADYFDSERNHNVFQKLFYNPQDYEDRWGILQERIKSVRDERARCRPIINKVIKRCPAESKEFYDAHFKPWGETRVTMERLQKWLTQPAENLTEKIRLIHNAAFDRCLHPARTGGHTNSIIPQAEDIRSCLDKKVSLRFITEVEAQQLRDKAKDVSHYAHVWRDPATSIVYPRRPSHLVQADIPPTCLHPVPPPQPLRQPTSQPTSQRSTPVPSNASDAGYELSSSDDCKETSPAATPSRKRRKLSQASVEKIEKSMRDVSNLAKSPLPPKRPSVSALGSRACPLHEPNPVEHGLWEYVYDYATAYINGVKQPKSSANPQVISADVDALTAAVNRLNIGINRLPQDRREAGAVLFAKGLCCGVTMCTEARSAQYLFQMYEIIRRWQQEFPSQSTGNMPGRSNQPLVDIRQGRQVDNNMGVMHNSLLTLLVDEGHPTGWLNDEIVNAGIAVRSDPRAVQVVNSLLWDRLVRVQHDPTQAAENMPQIREDRIPALTFIPINRGLSHWVLGWIDTRTRQYGILDSLVGSSNAARHNVDLQLMRDFMRYYGRLYYSRRSGETIEPTYIINTDQSPQQNADDCGVFVIMNAWYMLSGGRVGQLPWFDTMQRRLQIMNEIYQAASRMRAIPLPQRENTPALQTSSQPQSSASLASQAPLVTRSRPGSIDLSGQSAASDTASTQNQGLFIADSRPNSPTSSNQTDLRTLLAGATQNRGAPTPQVATPPRFDVSSASTPVF
jgi:hypothetical protein